MILPRYKPLVSLATVALAVGLTACGGSSSSKTSTTARTATSSSSSTKAATSTALHASLHAENHTPTAGKLWSYTVLAQANGHPASGTVRIQFVLAGLVVGTDHPPVHPIKNGRWHDQLTFPKAAVGHPLALQAVVQTSAGSATLNWPVTVKP